LVFLEHSTARLRGANAQDADWFLSSWLSLTKQPDACGFGGLIRERHIAGKLAIAPQKAA
jgi:hypothetical protein